MLTCTGVSFFHGSNDGQKGMGLIMLILVGVVPGAFALNMATAPADSQKAIVQLQQAAKSLAPMAGTTTLTQEEAQKELSAYVPATGPKASERTFAALITECQFVAGNLSKQADIKSIPREERTSLRTDVYLIDEAAGKVLKKKLVTDAAAAKDLGAAKKSMFNMTKYIPTWVKIAVALALGCGTMIGWKRIVVTVGEKIGKSHLTYAQGASAEIVAASTIGVADFMVSRSVRPTCSPPASPGPWRRTARVCRKTRSSASCWPGCSRCPSASSSAQPCFPPVSTSRSTSSESIDPLLIFEL